MDTQPPSSQPTPALPDDLADLLSIESLTAPIGQHAEKSAQQAGTPEYPLGPTLQANLAALRRTSPDAARAIAAVAPRRDLTFVQTDEGVLSATLTEHALPSARRPDGALGLVQRALASRRRPLEEARRLTGDFDPAKAAAVVITGFGLGWHVRQIAERLGTTGVILVFEPDLALLRAVLERIDHTAWLNTCNLVLLSDESDEAALAQACHGAEHALALGTHILEHPPSAPRLGERARRFLAAFTRVMQAVRTTVVTTMVQTEATLRNLTQNLDHYALGHGLTDLHRLYAGMPAICVAAGPSLARALQTLRRPEVRQRFVIVAAQTVLKTLLAHGIRPHFVTALDYHEISARFYEGLTPDDVRGITLVVEPKVNPAVTGAFPGTIRCAADEFLDALLGPALSRPMGTLEPGATVAHLSTALARFLGCDPVILVGQDLGFTDHQYYSAGAAIHDVWAGELNEFQTLETLEWQRIARHRPLLIRGQDARGRPVYTDQQMHTYLVQFQRQFKAWAEQGLRTIDATGGGLSKLFTAPMSLDEAVHAFTPERPLPESPVPAPGLHATGARRAAVRRRLQDVRRDVARIAEGGREAGDILRRMLRHHDDQGLVNDLIDRVHRVRDRVTALQPAFALVERLNQTGAFNRTRADRAIAVDAESDALDTQRRQIERDITNVSWIADAADALGRMLDEALATLDGGPRRTRDPISPAPATPAPPTTPDAQRTANAPPATPCAPGDAWGALALPPRLTEHGADRRPLRLLLARLARSERLRGVVVLCADERAAREACGDLSASRGRRPEVRFVTTTRNLETPGPVRAARAWARDCWRAGLANFTPADAALDPALLLEARRATGAAALLTLSPDWPLVDPALLDEIVRRAEASPSNHRFVFTPAAPGLTPVLLDARTIDDLAANRPTAQGFASVGGLLAYVPIAPSPDLLARDLCVGVPVPARDLSIAPVVDAPGVHGRLLEALAMAGLDPVLAGAADIASALESFLDHRPPDAPRELILRIADADGLLADPAWITPILDALARAAREGLTLGAPALTLIDPAQEHPALADLVRAARSAGIEHVHVRTALLGTPDQVKALLDSAPSVLSVDLVSPRASDFGTLAAPLARRHALQPEEAFARSRANLDLAAAQRTLDPDSHLHTPWIVPRLTKRDAVLDVMEDIYDIALMRYSAAVIDPPPDTGDRLTPLPLPRTAIRRRRLRRLEIGPDGCCTLPTGASVDVAASGLLTAWRLLRSTPIEVTR